MVMCKEHADQLRKLEAQLRLRDETEAWLRQALALAEQKLATREREIAHLTARLDKLRRMKFGRSSEKRARQIAELEAGLKALEQDSDAPPVGSMTPPYRACCGRPARANPSLNPLPAR